jgi:predicted homoserine dehydrogenase-like protein
MNFARLLSASREARIAIVGVGDFGRSLWLHSCRVPGLRTVALIDPKLAQIVEEMPGGPGGPDARICESAKAASEAVSKGEVAGLLDTALLWSLDVDIVVEATGNAAAAASVAATAIDAGKHCLIATKEADNVVGPVLAERARRAAVVYAPVDGDQPSLLMTQLSWCSVLGLEVVCAGKSSEYDFVVEPERGRVLWRGQSHSLANARGLLSQDDSLVERIARRRAAFVDIPMRTVPDLCELSLVCNLTGLVPDCPTLHAPHVRPNEVVETFIPRAAGGLLDRNGVVDVFNCVRRADDLSFAGGVFVIVRCRDRATWRLLGEKGHPISASGEYAMLYNPQHLLGIEAGITALECFAHGEMGRVDLGHYADPVRPVCDLVAVARRGLARGTRLTVTDHHHHEVDVLEPRLVPAAALGAQRPVPYYMLVGRTLTADVAAGEAITAEKVELDRSSELFALKQLQDRHFFVH